MLNNNPYPKEPAVKRLPFIVAAMAAALVLSACSAPPQTTASPVSTPTTSVSDADAMTATVEFIDAGLPDLDGASIAYLAECTAVNTYCQTRLRGAEDIANDAGAELVVFDANFDPATQLTQVQDAVQRGFDGYLFSPVAAASGCSDFAALTETGKPVATINSPMCGDTDYTEGAVGFVAMQTKEFFYRHVENAFASCEDECEAVAVGGYAGTDLFARWESAIRRRREAPERHRRRQPAGQLRPRLGTDRRAGRARREPRRVDHRLVVGRHDARRRPGGRRRRRRGRAHLQRGRHEGRRREGGRRHVERHSVLLPYEESAYGMAQLVKALATGEDTPGFTFLADAPVLLDGPGSIFITADNAATFSPEY